MIQQKTILQGCLHFGNEKSFGRARQMFEGRLETYYKNELAFSELEHFNEDLFTFEVPRTVTAVSVKTWKNTVDAMRFLAQYAVCGRIEAYQTDAGNILKQEVLVPNNDKQAVRDYWKAVLLFDQNNLTDAKLALDFCLGSYKHHTQALELHGKIAFMEGDSTKAIQFFTRALKTHPRSYSAYFQRGLAFMKEDEFEKAVADFENAIKHSLAILDIHWRARMEKARGLIELGSHESARKELKFFVQRQFDEKSDNYELKREAYLLASESFRDTKAYDISIECLDKAILQTSGESKISTAECIFKRGVIKRESGIGDFDQDLARATELGYAHRE